MSAARDSDSRPAVALALGLALAALASPAARALPPCTSQIDVQPAPGAGAQLGCTVATDGSVVASGAHQDSTAAPAAGAIYVIQRGGTVRLTAADAHAGDQLGFALALAGSTLVAGAPLGDAPGAADSGAVYVFSRPGSSWTAASPQVELTGPNAHRGDQFGQAAALSGDRIAVGAPSRTGAGSLSGAVYVFVRNGGSWALEAEIADPDALPLDGFGFALALDGDTLAVGAPFADAPGRGNSGAVHVFTRQGSSWIRRARIADPEGRSGDELGNAVALSGGTLVAGARRADVSGLTDAGAALVFARADAGGAAWTLRAKLTAAPPGADDLFGSAVAIAGSRILVGGPHHDAGGHNAGAGFVFDSLTGPPLVLLGLPPEAGAALGQSVAAFGDAVALGAHLADTGGRVDSGGLLACPSPLAPPVCPATRVTKDDGRGQVRRGQEIAYRIKVADAAPGASVADDFAAILDGGSWCRGEGCTDRRAGPLADPLPSGGAAVYTVRGRVAESAGNKISNKVTVAASGCPTAEAVDEDRVVSENPCQAGTPRDLFATVAGPLEAPAGSEATYSVQAGNLDLCPATGVALRVTPPAGATFVRVVPAGACTPAGLCSIGRLEGGEIRLVEITYRLSAQGGQVEVVATVEGNEPDPALGNNTDRQGTTVVETPPPKADLGVAISAPSPLPCSIASPFTVAVSNAGPGSAEAVEVDVLSPSLVPPPPATACGEVIAGGLRCHLASLAAGQSAAFELSLQAPGPSCQAPPASVPIGAAVRSATMDPNAGNNGAQRTLATDCPVNAPVLALAKDDGLASAAPGQTVLYTITASNAGSCPAEDVRLEDVFPPELRQVRWCRGADCAPDVSGDLADTFDLAPGGSAVYRLSGFVAPDAPGCQGTLDNTARLLFGATESTASDSDAIAPEPGVTGLCGGIDGSPVENGVITYTFVLHNGGPHDQQDNPGPEFFDQLPFQLLVLSATASSGTVFANLPANTVSWNGSIPVCGTVTITITARIQGAPAGTTVSNQALLFFDADGDGVNESTGMTDDPAQPGDADPCTFRVLAPVPPGIPTLAPGALAFLALLLALFAGRRLRRA
ncbi:MAG TPA: hypothetical protein VN783_13115 [Thermoanaerobaculia bacterium]|nr:hypothetical protein [Thermoanaerobaculia bacterium]